MKKIKPLIVFILSITLLSGVVIGAISVEWQENTSGTTDAIAYGDSKVFVATGDNIEIFNRDGTRVRNITLPSHSGTYVDIEYLKSENTITTYDTGETVIEYDLDSDTEIWTTNARFTNDVDVAENGYTVVGDYSGSGGVCLYDTDGTEIFCEFTGGANPAQVAIDNESNTVVLNTQNTLWAYDYGGNQIGSHSISGDNNQHRNIAGYGGKFYTVVNDNLIMWENDLSSNTIVSSGNGDVGLPTGGQIVDIDHQYYITSDTSGTIIYNLDTNISEEYSGSVSSPTLAIDAEAEKVAFYNDNNDLTRYITDIEGLDLGAPGPIVTLEININSWMGYESTQPYEIILNQTNRTTGDRNITDVTANANVTIYNITNTSGFSEPIVTVNNSTDTIKSYNETGVVAVNVTYDGETANATNLTVANRNLSNIGILPPGQYISAFLGVDDTTGGHNIESETQWIIFIVIVAAGFGRAFDNDWIGLGLGTLTAILLWVVGFVGIGVMYTVVFFAIFVGVLKVRVVNNTSKMSVDINDTRDFRR